MPRGLVDDRSEPDGAFPADNRLLDQSGIPDPWNRGFPQPAMKIGSELTAENIDIWLINRYRSSDGTDQMDTG